MKSESARAAARDAAAADLLPSEPRAWLSALADGDAGAVQQACAAWRDDTDAQQQWHTYHLIGDVMRSEELAVRPAHDAAFLNSLRTRLAQEPVVLAPSEPLAARVSARRRPTWLMPVAAAAGFVVVAGVLVVARVGMPGGAGEGDAIANAQDGRGNGVHMVSDVQRRPAPMVDTQGLIRDARLDAYLRAHQSARGGVAVASPSGAMRRVDQTVTVGSDR